MFNVTGSGMVEGAGVVLSIFLIIFLIRRGWKLYWVLLLAILALLLTNGDSFIDNAVLFYRSLTGYTSFYLVSMVVGITLLGNLHQQIGAMEQLVESLRRLIRDPRLLLIIFPAAISLFSTVPGGAIISAPMVEETGRELKLTPLELAMSNIVYRHMIVPITPFNSGLVLASGITGLSIAGSQLCARPAVVIIIATVMLPSGYPCIKKEKTGALNGKETWVTFTLLITASPYVLAIILGLACGLFFPALAGIAACFVEPPAWRKPPFAPPFFYFSARPTGP